MAKDLTTNTHAFDCDYCVPFDGPRRQLFLRIPTAQLMDAVAAFQSREEISSLHYSGKPIYGFSRLVSMANEGEQYFFVLE